MAAPTTTIATFKNAKGETLQVVRAQNAQDARYIAGVHQSNTSAVVTTTTSPTTSECDNGRK